MSGEATQCADCKQWIASRAVLSSGDSHYPAGLGWARQCAVGHGKARADNSVILRVRGIAKRLASTRFGGAGHCAAWHCLASHGKGRKRQMGRFFGVALFLWGNGMADSFRVTFDDKALLAALDDLGDGATALARPTAQAGAEVLYRAAKAKAPQSKKGHWFYGTSFRLNGTKYWFDSGSLRKSIYQVYSKDHSDEDRATYHIAWNHKKVPYGFMVEYGTSRAPAHPFIRPAFDSSYRDALKAAEARFEAGMQKVLK